MAAEYPAPRQGRASTERAAASEQRQRRCYRRRRGTVHGEGCGGALPAVPRPVLISPPSLAPSLHSAPLCSVLFSACPAPPRPAGGVRAQPAAPPLLLGFYDGRCLPRSWGRPRRPLAEALPWCRRPPRGGPSAAARRAAETWGKFPSESVSTGRRLRAAPPARPERPRSGFPAPGGDGPGSRSCPASPPSPGDRRRIAELAPRSEPLQERGRPCPAAVGSAAPEPGRGRGVSSGQGWDGGRGAKISVTSYAVGDGWGAGEEKPSLGDLEKEFSSEKTSFLCGLGL